MAVARFNPNDDEVLAAIKNLIGAVARAKQFLIGGAVLGALVGATYAFTLPPYYTASTELVPASAMTESAGNTSALSALSSLAGGSSTRDLSPFDRLQLVMQSTGFAESLLNDEIARETLFPSRWDPRTKEWGHAPQSISERLKHIVESAEPDGTMAAAALKSHLKITPDSSGVTNVTFTAGDRAVALYMLELVLHRADDVVRHDYLAVAEGYSNYIDNQLPNITSVVSRQVLTEQLNRYQQTIVMARVNLPFAELALDPPYVPQQKSGPIIRIYGAVGALVGIAIAFMLSGLSLRWRLLGRWLPRVRANSVVTSEIHH